MKGFHYKNQILHCDELGLDLIAEEVQTPFYLYSYNILKQNYQRFAQSLKGIDASIHFAVKANSNLSVLHLLGSLGSGADCVSGGEIKRALKAGIQAGKIVFSGVGKTRDELIFALNSNIYQFNIESEAELEELNRLSIGLGKKAPIAIRVNPDVSANTLDHITTGKKENKFGIEYEKALAIYKHAASLPGIDVKAISCHIGSQILDLEPYSLAFTKIHQLYLELAKSGINIERLDLGGGLGVTYESEVAPSVSEYISVITNIFSDCPVKLMFEPGRWICADSGILVTKVIYTKSNDIKNFAIIDSAMNDLLRYSLYDAYHRIVTVQKPGSTCTEVLYDIVGPVCESTDIFARSRPLPEVKAGDLLAIETCGAYGAVMASTYNSRPLIKEIMVKDTQLEVVRAEQSFEDMVRGEKIVGF